VGIKMNIPIQTKPFSLRSCIQRSLEIIYRNFRLLIGIFIITHIPIYLFRLLLEQYAAKSIYPLSQITGSGVGALSISIMIYILNYLTLAFTILAYAFISETTILGKQVSFSVAMRHAASIFLKMVMTLIPGFLLLFFLIALVLSGSSLSCFLGIVIIPLCFFIGIFLFVVIYTIALRDVYGFQAYAYSWNLINGNWGTFITGYLALALAVLFLSSPILIPALLLSYSIATRIPVIGDIPADILAIWLLVGFTIIYLNVDYLKNTPIPTINSES